MILSLFLCATKHLFDWCVPTVQACTPKSCGMAKNGKSFRGTFIEEKDDKYHFRSGDRIFSIAPENLAPWELEFVKDELSMQKMDKNGDGRISREESESFRSTRNTEVVAPIPEGAFLPNPPMDRSKIPIINQADFGNKASDCVPSTICNFLLWWDQSQYLPISEKGDFERKSRMDSRHDGALFQNAKHGGHFCCGCQGRNQVSISKISQNGCDVSDRANSRSIAQTDATLLFRPQCGCSWKYQFTTEEKRGEAIGWP